MAGETFLKQVNGGFEEARAIQSSAGAGDAGKIPALDASGRFSDTMMPSGIGADTAEIMTSEALSAGNYVNVYESSGVKCRKADASAAGKPAKGFVLSSFGSGVLAKVYFEGTNTQVTGMTGGPVFLSDTTPGLGQATAPTGAGKVVQSVGTAVAATAVNFDAGPPITLA